MLRMATYTGFIQSSLQLRDLMPAHRTGLAVWLCNYSSATRVVRLDYSANGTSWTTRTLTASDPDQQQGSGVVVVPRGIVVASAVLPDAAVDSKFLRLRLDATADGEGVFAQIQSAAPVPDYPLMSWA